MRGVRTLTAGSCSVLGDPVDLAKPRHRRLVAPLVDPIPYARDMTPREQATLVAAAWYGNSPSTAERTPGSVGGWRHGQAGFAGLRRAAPRNRACFAAPP
ncbi:hypothetical protein [Streptomyces sp. rh34]|uniref:hypothetical protein n=1 Tax=Streptomyces sp. rh34 TaxID=2034272 RepID=UPI00211D5DA3|nr:hypothetical protein [Streptomyces sp. rh34]